jgi:transposase
LRRKGVHEAQLAEWRAAALAALQPPSRRERKAANIEKLKIRNLERELKRKEKVARRLGGCRRRGSPAGLR